MFLDSSSDTSLSLQSCGEPTPLLTAHILQRLVVVSLHNGIPRIVKSGCRAQDEARRATAFRGIWTVELPEFGRYGATPGAVLAALAEHPAVCRLVMKRPGAALGVLDPSPDGVFRPRIQLGRLIRRWL